MQLLFDFEILTSARLFVGQLDAFDRADRLAADQDLVVGDQLARVLEEQRVLVPAAAAEEDDRRGRSRPPRGRRSRAARAGVIPRLGAGPFSSPLGFGSHGSSLAVSLGPPIRENGAGIVSEPSPCQERRLSGDLTGIQRATLGPRRGYENREALGQYQTRSQAQCVNVLLFALIGAVTAAIAARRVAAVGRALGARRQHPGRGDHVHAEEARQEDRRRPVTLDVLTDDRQHHRPERQTGARRPKPCIDFDKNASIFAKGYPTCEAPKLRSRLDRSRPRSLQKGEDRRRRRDRAAAGRQRRAARRTTIVTAFNGVPQGGKPVVLLHVYGDSAGADHPGPDRRRHQVQQGRLRPALTSTSRCSPAASGALTEFHVKIFKNLHLQGQEAQLRHRQMPDVEEAQGPRRLHLQGRPVADPGSRPQTCAQKPEPKKKKGKK